MTDIRKYAELVAERGRAWMDHHRLGNAVILAGGVKGVVTDVNDMGCHEANELAGSLDMLILALRDKP